MSGKELKSLPSIAGYFNWHEARMVVLAVVGTDTFTQLAIEIADGLLKNAGKIYFGPNATLVVQICAALAALLAGWATGRTYARKGK